MGVSRVLFGGIHGQDGDGAHLQPAADLVDDIGLHRTRDRVRTGTIRQDDVAERATGLYLEMESRWR